MRIHFFEAQVKIEGSVHRLYNILHNRSNGKNYDDLSLEQAKWTFDHLKTLMDVNIFNGIIENIELGVNISMDAFEVLDSIITHKSNEIETNKTYSNGVKMIEFAWTNHYLKLYDKRSQCQLKRDVLRIEIKSMRNKHCQDAYSIRTVGDLFICENLGEAKRYL